MTTPEKLQRLRERYGADATITDPVFRRVTEMQFRGGRRVFPFAGVPTFLDLPYRPDAAELADFGELDVALIGVPMDLGVTNRSGSRFGPRAVRTVERVGPYEHVLRALPAADCAAADVGDVPLSSRFDLAACHADIEAYFDKVMQAGVVPIAIGGDHSITQAILRAVGRQRPVGLLHIDAHCDTGGPYEGSRFHHGGPFRQAVLDGVLDPERVIQIGIRGSAEYLWEFSYESGMTVIHAEEFASLGVKAVIERARAVLGSGPVYVSFDIDSVDPGFAPGTGTPEVGGLTPREVLAILRGVADCDIIGGDVVEVAPQYDATANTAHVATQMLFEIFCLAAGALARRQVAHG